MSNTKSPNGTPSLAFWVFQPEAAVCDCRDFPSDGNAEVRLGGSWIIDANGAIGAPSLLPGSVSVVGN